MKITRLASFGELSITSTDPSESFERGVAEIDTDHGRQIFVIIEGEAAVGAERTRVQKLDAIEVPAGEALALRAATSPMRYWKVEFDK